MIYELRWLRLQPNVTSHDHDKTMWTFEVGLGLLTTIFTSVEDIEKQFDSNATTYPGVGVLTTQDRISRLKSRFKKKWKFWNIKYIRISFINLLYLDYVVV